MVRVRVVEDFPAWFLNRGDVFDVTPEDWPGLRDIGKFELVRDVEPERPEQARAERA